MSKTFTVRFWSEHLESPEYIGPFYSQDEAEDYADDRNSSLALSGVPSWVACYSVVWLIMTTKTWVVKLEIVIDENTHPRKFIPDAIAECLNLEEGEDIIDYNFVCLDWFWNENRFSDCNFSNDT